MELRKTRRDYVKVTSGYFVNDHVAYGGNAIAGRAMNEGIEGTEISREICVGL